MTLITNFIINTFGLDFAKARRYALLILISLLLLIILILGWWINSCRTASFEKKKEEIKTNIQTGKIESNIQGNIVNQAANISNQALENVNKVKQTNLNSYSNNWNETRRRYCEAMPEDCK